MAGAGRPEATLPDMTTDRPVGFDPGAVEPWLAAHTPVVPPVSWTRLEGGHSNLTYLLVDAEGEEYVIRRPPQGELLPKAHDMFREYRIIAALHPAGIPVARPVGYCEDAAVCERHFYVMGRVGGQALYTAEQAAQHLTESVRPRVGPSFIGVLAAIHAVDPAAVGLEDLGRHDGYVARQLRTWYGSWVASAEAADYDDPRLHELHALLESRIPAQGPARVVHGDYGVHNSMVSSGGEVIAVLDWEIATLGDPLADFAYALNAWIEPGRPRRRHRVRRPCPDSRPGTSSCRSTPPPPGPTCPSSLLPGVQLVQDRLHHPRGVRPLPTGSEEHRGGRPPTLHRRIGSSIESATSFAADFA